MKSLTLIWFSACSVRYVAEPAAPVVPDWAVVDAAPVVSVVFAAPVVVDVPDVLFMSVAPPLASGETGAVPVAAGGVVVVPVASCAKATGAMAVEPSSMAAAIVVRVLFMVDLPFL
jgi:hypothetical protein